MTIEVRLPASLADARRAYDLAHALGEQALAAWPHLGTTEVTVRVHTNRSTLLSWRRTARTLALSLHEAFLPYPDDVLAMVDRRDPAAWARLQALPRAATPPRLTTAGAVHDLAPLWQEEVSRVKAVAPFTTEALVGWGRWPGRAPRRSLRLGSCQAGPPEVVRIHPVLDHASVPDWVVGFVLYHELLHLRFPPIQQGRRRIVHPKSFRQAERRHPRFHDAEAWERDSITGLLGRVRRHVQERKLRRTARGQ